MREGSDLKSGARLGSAGSDVRYALESSAKADIAGGPRSQIHLESALLHEAVIPAEIIRGPLRARDLPKYDISG
jgi:hypothetical protein